MDGIIESVEVLPADVRPGDIIENGSGYTWAWFNLSDGESILGILPTTAETVVTYSFDITDGVVQWEK